jgi:CDP-glucose 4,6-dehydratase
MLMRSSEPIPPTLNFGPSSDQVVPVQQLVDAATKIWGDVSGASCTFTLDAADESLGEATTLALDSSLAKTTLGWSNLLDWHYALSMTLSWYYQYNQGMTVQTLIREQIDEYSAITG